MQIYNKAIKDEVIAKLISKIKQKKELSNVEDSIIREKIAQILKQSKKLLKFFSESKEFRGKSSEVKYVIKTIRKDLRVLYGVYQIDADKIKRYLQELKKNKQSLDLHKKILSLHLSSKERLNIYPQFYKEIFAITGKPNSIIDLGCGLNPFSYPFMELGDIEYIAVELNKKDAEMIQEYFDIIGIKGKAIAADITKGSFRHYKADVCFAFKVFDFIPNKQVERIVKELEVKWIIATFSTKTIAGKKMIYPKRGGFQRMLKRLGYSYKKSLYPNELVYVIEK